MDAIRNERLRNQHLTAPTIKDPVDVLKTLVAIQAQDFAGAKWALALRTSNSTDLDVEQAFSEGRILRLHVMRPTWHFVTPEDIRWLVQLTAPRIKALGRHYFRKTELDEKVFRRTNKALVKALEGGRQLTRSELREVVAKAGVEPGDSPRFGYILMRAEQDELICSGARKGNQFTYTLLAERVRRSRILDRDEALGELALRYFRTRGPATVSDFAWWSGLTVADAKRGIEINGKQLTCKSMNDKRYWSAPEKLMTKVSCAHLLPLFDEYFIAYKDRSAALHPKLKQRQTRFVFDPPMVMAGQVVGYWQRVLTKAAVRVQLRPLVNLTRSDGKAFIIAAETYARFLGKELILSEAALRGRPRSRTHH